MKIFFDDSIPEILRMRMRREFETAASEAINRGIDFVKWAYHPGLDPLDTNAAPSKVDYYTIGVDITPLFRKGAGGRFDLVGVMMAAGLPAQMQEVADIELARADGVDDEDRAILESLPPEACFVVDSYSRADHMRRLLVEIRGTKGAKSIRIAPVVELSSLHALRRERRRVIPDRSFGESLPDHMRGEIMWAIESMNARHAAGPGGGA